MNYGVDNVIQKKQRCNITHTMLLMCFDQYEIVSDSCFIYM